MEGISRSVQADQDEKDRSEVDLNVYIDLALYQTGILTNEWRMHLVHIYRERWKASKQDWLRTENAK